MERRTPSLAEDQAVNVEYSFAQLIVRLIIMSVFCRFAQLIISFHFIPSQPIPDQHTPNLALQTSRLAPPEPEHTTCHGHSDSIWALRQSRSVSLRLVL